MKPGPSLVALLVAAVALSGCTDAGSTDDGLSVDSGSSVTTADNKTLTFGPHSGLPRERDANWTATFDAAPQWTLGEWWDLKITDGFVGRTHEVTRVAAGKEGLDYLVGMPLEEFNDEVMVLHFPGFGLVHSSTLGHEAHDYLFEPLRFPLEVGNAWDSLWQAAGNTVTHEVVELDEGTMTATIQMSGAQAATYTYDATMGVISRFDAPGYMTYKVTDHGFEHQGVVRVPYSHDMTIYHGRFGPVTPLQQSEGAILSTTGNCFPGVGGCGDVIAPIETFTIPEGYDRASFALIIFELGQAVTGVTTPTGNGVYQVSAEAPDGQTFELQKLPTENGHRLEGFYHDAPAGEWDLQVVSAGPGLAFIEGITYNTYDVELPSGCVEVTENVHDHGGTCGGHVHGIG